MEKLAALIIDSCSGSAWDRFQVIFDTHARERILGRFELYPKVVTREDVENSAPIVEEVEVLFGAWGFPVLSEEEVSRFKRLKHIFYAAGTAKYFGIPFLSRGIGISTSKMTNAKAVAMFCFSQIQLSAKGYFHSLVDYTGADRFDNFSLQFHELMGLKRSTVGLIGCGQIAQKLLLLLAPIGCRVLVCDPFLTTEQASVLSVEKTTIQQVFESCDIVSNHLPNLPDLEGVIGYELVSKMKANSTFINTGRGHQVDNEGLWQALAERADVVALLDVTHPEPPVGNSPYFSLPNVFITPHIAGCIGWEVKDLAIEAIETSERWLAGLPLENAEKLDLYDQIA